MIRIQGSEGEILALLWRLYYFGEPETDPGVAATYAAIVQLEEGNRIVMCGNEQYEVLESEWTIEQDVYGCEKGRACTSVTSEQRKMFELMIAVRLEGKR